MNISYQTHNNVKYCYVNIPTTTPDIASEIFQQIKLSFELQQQDIPNEINILDFIHTVSTVTHSGHNNKFLVIYEEINVE